MGLLVLAMLVAYTARHYRTFEWARFWHELGGLDWRWTLSGLGLSVASFVGRAWRWQVLMRPARAPLRAVLADTFIGFSAVVLLGRPGEFVRPYLIARHAGTPVANQAAVWFLERLWDFVTILFFFGFGLSQARQLDLPPNAGLETIVASGGWLLAGLAATVVGIIWVFGRKGAVIHDRVVAAASALPARWQAGVSESLESFLAGFQRAGQPGTLWDTLLLTVLEWLLILGAIWCYFAAFRGSGGGLGVAEVVAYLGFVSLGSIVQLPGIGGGMQIASVLVLTELFRVPVEAATGQSLMIWAGANLLVLPVGLPLAVRRGVNVFKLSDMKGAAAS